MSSLKTARLPLILLLVISCWMAVSCASGPPTLDQRSVLKKLDLRIQLALSEEPTEVLGRYLRVVAVMHQEPSADQMDSLWVRGVILDQTREFVTMTVAVSRLARLAAYKPVRRVELDMNHAPPPAAVRKHP